MEANKIIPLSLEFVNEQERFHLKRAKDGKLDEWRRKVHLETAAKFTRLAEYVTKLQEELERVKQQPIASLTKHPLTLNLEEVEGLPQELLEELSISEGGDKTEFAIRTLIDEAGGLLSLDKILVGLFRKTGEVHKRAAMTNRLYRMVQKGTIFSVPTKKGAYSTRELTADEVERLLDRRPTPQEPST